MVGVLRLLRFRWFDALGLLRLATWRSVSVTFGMENPGTAKQNVQQSTQCRPIMLMIERLFKFDSQDLRPSTSPYRNLMETDRISRDPPDPEHFYDGDDNVVYCRNVVAASHAEQTLKSLD
jgi:hypothetical protein